MSTVTFEPVECAPVPQAKESTALDHRLALAGIAGYLTSFEERRDRGEHVSLELALGFVLEEIERYAPDILERARRRVFVDAANETEAAA